MHTTFSGKESSLKFGDGRDWFFEKRFGMFIHWGLYAIPGWHEQIQYRQGLPRKEYQKLIHQFNPTEFNPDSWLDLAEQTGMEYMTFTTKHIDGFCMWDTKQTDYNVMNTPYGKDILRMLSDACHRRNFPLCLYYSIVDNNHLNYPNSGKGHEVNPEPGDEPNRDKYLDFLKAQIRELCTEYGEIHGIWWDANRFEGEIPEMNEMIHSLQPKAMINERGFSEGDFWNLEREYLTDGVQEISSFDRPMEGCQSVGAESWGYREDEDYFSTAYLIDKIDDFLVRGANYLLNVGPKADGTICDEAVAILEKIGEWYNSVKEAFDGTEPIPPLNPNVLMTGKDNTLYIHFPIHSPRPGICLRPLQKIPHKAVLLNTGDEVETRLARLPSNFQDPGEYLVIRNLPINELCDTVMVVKLEFDDLSDFIHRQEVSQLNDIG